MKMKKSKKIAFGLCLMFAVTGLTACKQEVTMQEKILSDTFENIAIVSKTEDIEILPATDGTCKVISPQRSGLQYNVRVQEDTLMVELEDTRKWYQYISFDFETPALTVYLPDAEYKTLSIDTTTCDVEVSKGLRFENVAIDLSTGDVDCEAFVTESVKIKTSTGDIEVENATVKSMELASTTGDIEVKSVHADDIKISVSTGDVHLEDITCNNLTATASTGDLTMDNVVASGNFTIDVTTGDVTFNGCDAGEILVETTTGSVTGTLLSEKIFIARTSSGSIDVPETLTGGKCKITTTSGRIKIEIKAN